MRLKKITLSVLSVGLLASGNLLLAPAASATESSCSGWRNSHTHPGMYTYVCLEKSGSWLRTKAWVFNGTGANQSLRNFELWVGYSTKWCTPKDGPAVTMAQGETKSCETAWVNDANGSSAPDYGVAVYKTYKVNQWVQTYEQNS
ncbi:hypothetical protein ABZV60_16830 [Streptomyces sp. NPDC004787]|uniref:hypothetical protein n=1 Tax=Streptomyces sp. NPDC004787 TaxID=3154291 RepID=UPI0033A98020